MIFFFVLVIVAAAAVVLISLFAPHKLPWYRPHLVLNSAELPVKEQIAPKQPIILEGLVDPEPENNFDTSLQERINKLEIILTEKNIAIEKLQKQVAAERSHREDFEKVQVFLNEEIQNLRAQNKELKGKRGE